MADSTPTTHNPFDEPRIIPDSEEVFETYRVQILIGAALLVLGLLGGTGWWIWKHSQENEAMAAYHEAKDSEAMASLAAASPNTAAGGFALLRVARDHKEAGRWNEALLAYQDFLDYHPKNPLAPAAELGAAFALESLERYPEAINAYQALVSASPAHPFAAAAHIGLARVYRATGQTDAAREILASLIASNSSSAFLAEAEEILKRIAPPAGNHVSTPAAPPAAD